MMLFRRIVTQYLHPHPRRSIGHCLQEFVTTCETVEKRIRVLLVSKIEYLDEISSRRPMLLSEGWKGTCTELRKVLNDRAEKVQK